ncbi:MAG TPA: DUF4405 domain-containing protein [Anaerolineales bacterium]|nr:DUF4405 domain-containing protein [Anaerolineales bacterium]HMZ07869.1 DUF4405 domain-containing protein [Anaerolineales bacterium]HNA89386.1 DUF4405 domain-containing protein [Anaerolineales bacterium]HNB36077.1 DUF4405 domain-containing protein [Anaerolineales bacterium]HNC08679.1 DUF4405 domain-containing protein [Anaerolineales bacterium]
MSNTNRTKLLLDIALFVAFLITMDPRFSGLAIHEWLSIAAAATVIVHLLLSWEWIVNVTKRLFGRVGGGAKVNYVLNWLLFIDGILIMLSGIMISEVAVPALGLALPMNFAWRRLHDMSANLALLIMGLHLAMHWNWIVTTFKRVFLGGGKKQQQPAVISAEEA